MSLYAMVDETDCGQIATVKGWSDFIDWAGKQDDEVLLHLIEHGYSTRLSELAAVISSYLRANPPARDVRTTAKGVVDICRQHSQGSILIVTDGGGNRPLADDDESDD